MTLEIKPFALGIALVFALSAHRAAAEHPRLALAAHDQSSVISAPSIVAGCPDGTRCVNVPAGGTAPEMVRIPKEAGWALAVKCPGSTALCWRKNNEDGSITVLSQNETPEMLEMTKEQYNRMQAGTSDYKVISATKKPKPVATNARQTAARPENLPPGSSGIAGPDGNPLKDANGRVVIVNREERKAIETQAALTGGKITLAMVQEQKALLAAKQRQEIVATHTSQGVIGGTPLERISARLYQQTAGVGTGGATGGVSSLVDTQGQTGVLSQISNVLGALSNLLSGFTGMATRWESPSWGGFGGFGRYGSVW